MVLSVEALLEPISGPDPCGIDPRTETGAGSLYFKLKDARAQARLAERTAEGAGESVVLSAGWQDVRDLSVEVLGSRGKDVEVAAWLVEALVRLDGFEGLAVALSVAAGLFQRYWPDLHSIDKDDTAGRVSPLAGLNGIGGEGALIQPIRMVPLLPGTGYGSNALWHLGRVRRDPTGALARDFNEARTAAGLVAIRARAQQAAGAREAYVRLTSVLDDVCGASAPPSSNIRNVLDEVLDAFRSLIGGDVDQIAPAVPDGPETVETSVDRVETVAGPLPSDRPAVQPRELMSREDAFGELLRVADFFRRNEPHSPISYSLETLVWRGRMSFIDLLQELLPDEGQRKQLLQHAGIQAKPEVRSH